MPFSLSNDLAPNINASSQKHPLDTCAGTQRAGTCASATIRAGAGADHKPDSDLLTLLRESYEHSFGQGFEPVGLQRAEEHEIVLDNGSNVTLVKAC